MRLPGEIESQACAPVDGVLDESDFGCLELPALKKDLSGGST